MQINTSPVQQGREIETRGPRQMFRRSGRRDRDFGLPTGASLPAPCNHLCGLALSRRACSLNPRGQALHMKPNLAPLSLAGLFLWPGCSKMQRALWVS
jgi:hypothetical protein